MSGGSSLLPLDKIERVILPEIVIFSWQIEGRGEFDRAFCALLVALYLESVALVLACGRNTGETRERARTREAEFHDGLELIDVYTRYAAAVPARPDGRLDAHVNRSPDLGGRRLRRRALARGLLWRRARQAFRDAVEPAGRARRAILGLGRGLGGRLGRGLLRRLLLGRCGLGAL